MLLRIRASILRLARGEFGDQRLGAAERCVACIEAHLWRRRPPHLSRSLGHAGAGGARNRAISDRTSANICRDTATSAI
jgi:CO/xanthine dehydrogenase FAD-binding subunit